MAFELPQTLSPSKVSAFTDCALAFKFSAIDRLPQPPTVWATKGTLVHRALELLHLLAPEERTLDAALGCLADATTEIRADPEFTELALDQEAEADFLASADTLVRRYFELEDPSTIRSIGLELTVAADIDGIRVRGIIDRLELDDRGDLIVTDYKTGAVPAVQQERKRLAGVHLYSLLCEELLGKRPKKVQLLYLSQPVALITEPRDRSTRSTRRTLAAIWQAVERACEREDFRPRPSVLCDYCAYKPYCPAFGGDPEAAKVDVGEADTTEPLPQTA